MVRTYIAKKTKEKPKNLDLKFVQIIERSTFIIAFQLLSLIVLNVLQSKSCKEIHLVATCTRKPKGPGWSLVAADLLVFYQIFLSQQVNRSAIISNKHNIYGLPYDLPSDLRLRILGNY